MHTTSGTTGTPQPVFFGAWDREVQNLLLARAYLLQGLRPDDVVHSVYGFGMVNGGHYIREALVHFTKSIVLPAGTGIETRSEQQVELMRAFGATVIVGFVDYVKRLAQVARDKGIVPGRDIKIRMISGHVGREDRGSISAAWGGAEIYDWYGVADTGIIAAEGPDHDGLYVWEDAHHVEVIDPDTRAPRPDGELGNLCVTTLFKDGAERNKALGAWGAIGATGATIGLLAGGTLTRYAGWQYIFYLNVPIGAAVLLLARLVVPESRLAGARRRYDPLGAITVTGALVLLVYAISQAPTVGWTAIRTLALLAAAAALLAGFLVIETRAEAPLLPLRLFRLKTLAGSNAVGFLLGASFFSFFFTGTLYMQQVLGYSALKTGIAWLATSVTFLALAGPAQMLVTRASAKLVMAAGMIFVGSGILWATQVPVHGHYWANLAGPLFLAGGTAFAFIPVTIGALAGVTDRDAGTASGLLNTSQQIGGAIGVAVASTIAALTGGFQWAFWVTGLTGLAAVPVTFLLIRRTEIATAVATARQQKPPVPAPAD